MKTLTERISSSCRDKKNREKRDSLMGKETIKLKKFISEKDNQTTRNRAFDCSAERLMRKTERTFAELMDKHETTQDEQTQRALEHLMDSRDRETVRSKYFVELLNQKIDNREGELAAARERYDRHTFVWRSLLQHDRSATCC